MSANFDTFTVFVPAECEGMTWGYHPVKVLALDNQDAIHKACAEWHGTGAKEGTYIVCLSDALTAYEVDEKRVPDIGAQVSVPEAGAVT